MGLRTCTWTECIDLGNFCKVAFLLYKNLYPLLNMPFVPTYMGTSLFHPAQRKKHFADEEPFLTIVVQK